jgi:hypothetical protein
MGDTMKNETKIPNPGDIIKVWPWGTKGHNKELWDIVLVRSVNPLHLLPIKRNSGHDPFYYHVRPTEERNGMLEWNITDCYELTDIEILQ